MTYHGEQITVERNVTGPFYWFMSIATTGKMINPKTNEFFAGQTNWGWITDRNATQASLFGVGLPDSNTLRNLADPTFNQGYESFFRVNNTTDLYATQGLDFGLQNYTWAVAAPVPEADTYAMLALGMGLVGWIGRRRGGASRAA